MTTLAVRHFNQFDFYYRPGSSDERVMKEVIDQHTYRRNKLPAPTPIIADGQHIRGVFDVQPTEEWLDLGANIGAFAAYAALRGAASVECWEPDPDCYKILVQNLTNIKVGMEDEIELPAFRYAVTHLKSSTIPFFRGRDPKDHYRQTFVPNKNPHPAGQLPNIHASLVISDRDAYGDPCGLRFFDGVKMDIEGAELGIIDNGLIPKCNKLVMEYHLSKDRNMKNFRRRMQILRQYFKNVSYLASLDKGYPNDTYPGFYDRLIFCYQ